MMLGAAFAFFILEFGFVMLTVLLSQVGLGELAWVRILGGNVVGAVLTFVMLSRRHPLRQELEQAAADEEEARPQARKRKTRPALRRAASVRKRGRVQR